MIPIISGSILYYCAGLTSTYFKFFLKVFPFENHRSADLKPFQHHLFFHKSLAVPG
jgi:hypothetical protein